MKKKFDAAAWLAKSGKKETDRIVANKAADSRAGSDIDTVTQRIEAAGVDITDGYKNWLELGFALSDELGENGRGYFHRISRFNPEYSPAETDRQYDNCLKSKGSGITIRSFFQRVKESGINISTSHSSYSSVLNNGNESSAGSARVIPPNDGFEECEEIEEALPTFAQAVLDRLPHLLQKVVVRASSDRDADILLLGALTCISACLSNVSGIYDRRKVYPNLFLFVTAPASSGKGRLSLCRRIVDPIHRNLRQRNEAERETYKMLLNSYNSANKKDRVNMEKPEEPPLRVLVIPANASATAVYQTLNENGGVGLMFETEGDTLANTLASDYGNYSDGFRKVFHHETISYIRRKDKEYVEVREPRLSVLLTGTPRQVANLIPNAENGLFSRFVFYRMEMDLVWKDVFAECEEGTAEEIFNRIGEEFFDYYNTLQNCGDVHVELTKEQGKRFNTFFNEVQKDYASKFGGDIVASVRRLGLTAFRIMMILSVLRNVCDGVFERDVVCLDEDFDTAMVIIKALLVHTGRVFKELQPLTVNHGMAGIANTRQNDFLSRLTSEFKRQDYLDVAKTMNISDATAERYIKALCDSGVLQRTAPGKFRKTE